jgi:KTSC domain-containing protein
MLSIVPGCCRGSRWPRETCPSRSVYPGNVLRAAVLSSALKSVGYRGGVLEIEVASGDVYRYLDVPREVFLEFMRAESKGSFYNERIRDIFRVEGPL